jgi:hypothetical protein
MLAWNDGGADADINSDGVVDILDAIILSSHFSARLTSRHLSSFLK